MASMMISMIRRPESVSNSAEIQTLPDLLPPPPRLSPSLKRLKPKYPTLVRFHIFRYGDVALVLDFDSGRVWSSQNLKQLSVDISQEGHPEYTVRCYFKRRVVMTCVRGSRNLGNQSTVLLVSAILSVLAQTQILESLVELRLFLPCNVKVFIETVFRPIRREYQYCYQKVLSLFCVLCSSYIIYTTIALVFMPLAP